ncbi:MAG: hypothetical protein WBK20_09465 [Spirochaetota bacterium]
MSIPLPIIFHAVCMIIGLIALLLAASISMKKKTNQWLKKHRLTALSGVTSVITGLIIMILFKESQGYPHLSSPHAIGGLVTGFMALITPTLGYLITKGKHKVKPLHKWSGRVTIILVAITIISGIIRLLEIVNK